MSEETERRYSEEYLSALSNILSGGLTVDDAEDSGLRPEMALMRVTGAMLKAVTLAKFNGDIGQESARWCMGTVTLSDDDTLEALSGIVALLQGAPIVLGKLRCDGEFRSTHERVETVAELREQAIRVRGEQAVKEQEKSAAASREGSAES